MSDEVKAPTLMDFAWDEVPELVTLPKGEEVMITIVKGEFKISTDKVDADGSPKKGLNYTLRVDGRPEVAPIFHYMGLPDASDTPEFQADKMRRIKRFWKAFDINPDAPGELPDHAGKSAYWVLDVDVYLGEEKNTLKSPSRKA